MGIHLKLDFSLNLCGVDEDCLKMLRSMPATKSRPASIEAQVTRLGLEYVWQQRSGKRLAGRVRRFFQR